MSVIGSLYGSLLRPETLVLTVTSSSPENLLHESCTERIYRLALITQSACGIAEKLESQEHHRRTLVRRPILAPDRKGDVTNPLGRAPKRINVTERKVSQLVRWWRLGPSAFVVGRTSTDVGSGDGLRCDYSSTTALTRFLGRSTSMPRLIASV
jgi:hypothetical protein